MDRPNYSELPGPMPPEQIPGPPNVRQSREVIIVGGGIAGLSAAIYLARALRDVLIIDAKESLAMWEPEVQNYLGFPECIDGRELLERGRRQALKYGAQTILDEVDEISREGELFRLRTKRGEYECKRLLLATGVYHLPPKIPGVNECVGKSMFFCKDCDGYRVQGKKVMIIGHNDEAVEYALGIMTFTESVVLLTNGETPRWSREHERWLGEHHVPTYRESVVRADHENGFLNCLTLANGSRLALDCLFTTRGDLFHNHLARQLGANLDEYGQILVDHCQHTSLPGLYAAGCVTPANCQMIIAAGCGATAGQAINRDLFEESLNRGTLREKRAAQLQSGKAEPVFLSKS